MSDDIKHNITEQSTWVRAFYMLIFFVIYSVAEVVLGAVIIFQFLTRLLTADINNKLLKFGAELSKFIYDILLFLTYNTDFKPFPFSDWQSSSDTVGKNTGQNASGDQSEPKKRTTKKSNVSKLKNNNSEKTDGKDGSA